MPKPLALKDQITPAMTLIAQARHHDPFMVLGCRTDADQDSLLAFRPNADRLEIVFDSGNQPLARITGSDFFRWQGASSQLPTHPTLVEHGKDGSVSRFIDPYSFLPVLPDAKLLQFHNAECWDSYDLLGAHPMIIDAIPGTLFSVWAPNAERVSVISPASGWDGRIHPMRCRGETGIWELFIPGMSEGELYKFEIRHRDTGTILVKTDPFGRHFELRPDTASKVRGEHPYQWQDQSWQEQRSLKQGLHQPLSIYEVHLGSWARDEQNRYLDYQTLAHRLVEYVKYHGFTHIQLMPVTEHPYDGSWGYQVTGFFAPTSRFGNPEAFKYFVDWCHQNEIGVILDWVPGHFPKDAHGLAHFDGAALYEHENPQLGEHKDWGTLIFNYGRREVKNFLLSSAHFWLQEFHVDGLRVDAVASMIYLDYSRKAGEWAPNRYGGNENLEAIDFLRRLNTILHEQHPGTLVIAEESTAWPLVSRPVYLGGLGFTMKWNMGWMNDTLAYIAQDPIHRKYHHDKLTFSLLYAFSENFVLPFSHDEVVHGKRSILEKMPGDSWQKFANVRLLYTYLYTHPGKKLLFMGNEFAQGNEWNHDRSLDWWLSEYPLQKGVQTLVKDLNNLYRADASLHQYDFEHRGFQWIDCHDSSQSVISFLRWSDTDFSIAIFNFTPVIRSGYRIGVPEPGVYREVLNSDSRYYQGSDVSNGTQLHTEAFETMGFKQSLVLTLPPLAGIIIKRTDVKKS